MKVCNECGKEFPKKENMSEATYKKRKYCSTDCAIKGQRKKRKNGELIYNRYF